MQQHIGVVGEVRERAYFRGRVQRSALAGLRDRDDAWHGVVYATAVADGGGNRGRGDLAMRGRYRDEFAAEKFLRCAALIGPDVRTIGAIDGVERTCHRRDAEHICAGTAKREIDFDPGPERVAQGRDRASTVGVVAVGRRRPGIRARNRVENVGMNTGSVVAGEEQRCGCRRGTQWRSGDLNCARRSIEST